MEKEKEKGNGKVTESFPCQPVHTGSPEKGALLIISFVYEKVGRRLMMMSFCRACQSPNFFKSNMYGGEWY